MTKMKDIHVENGQSLGQLSKRKGKKEQKGQIA